MALVMAILLCIGWGAGMISGVSDMDKSPAVGFLTFMVSLLMLIGFIIFGAHF